MTLLCPSVAEGTLATLQHKTENSIQTISGPTESTALIDLTNGFRKLPTNNNHPTKY